eukprot:scaffold130514_cov79-Cyclotella_meneghiniana.AAC.8
MAPQVTMDLKHSLHRYPVQQHPHEHFGQITRQSHPSANWSFGDDKKAQTKQEYDNGLTLTARTLGCMDESDEPLKYHEIITTRECINGSDNFMVKIIVLHISKTVPGKQLEEHSAMSMVMVDKNIHLQRHKSCALLKVATDL